MNADELVAGIPDSPAGRQLAWLLDKLGRGKPPDDHELNLHVDGRMTKRLTAEEFGALRDVFGDSPSVVRAERRGDAELFTEILGRGDVRYIVPIRVETEEPHRISSIGVNTALGTHIRNIVIACPDGTFESGKAIGPPHELAMFYAELLGMQIVREDWIKVGRDRRIYPKLAFGDGPTANYCPPRSWTSHRRSSSWSRLCAPVSTGPPAAM